MLNGKKRYGVAVGSDTGWPGKVCLRMQMPSAYHLRPGCGDDSFRNVCAAELLWPTDAIERVRTARNGGL